MFEWPPVDDDGFFWGQEEILLRGSALFDIGEPPSHLGPTPPPLRRQIFFRPQTRSHLPRRGAFSLSPMGGGQNDTSSSVFFLLKKALTIAKGWPLPLLRGVCPTGFFLSRSDWLKPRRPSPPPPRVGGAWMFSNLVVISKFPLPPDGKQVSATTSNSTSRISHMSVGRCAFCLSGPNERLPATERPPRCSKHAVLFRPRFRLRSGPSEHRPGCPDQAFG